MTAFIRRWSWRSGKPWISHSHDSSIANPPTSPIHTGSPRGLFRATQLHMNRVSRSSLPPDVEESVQAWQSLAVPDAVFLQGTTRSYSIDPIAECVFGVV